VNTIHHIRLAGFSGLFAPGIMLVALWQAISRAPWFSWQDNYLSDLGVAEGSELIFNAGLIVGGMLFLLLISGLRAYLPARPAISRALAVLGASAVALACVGIFDEDFGSLHYIVSVLFFSLSAIGLMMLGRTEYKMVSKRRGSLTFAMGLGVALAWALPWPGEGGALPEMAGAVCIMAVALVYGATLVLSVCPFSAK
jgi:hypothetical membrane protein